MTHIFFVASFGSIYRRVLPLIDSVKEEDVLVVTPNENIYKFFKNYTPFHTIQIKTNPNLISKDKWYMAPVNAIRSKIEYNKLFKNIKYEKVYFFSTGSAIVLFSYIQKLARNNSVYFYSSEPDKLETQIKPTIVENWKTKMICLAVKILLGIDVKVRRDCGLYSICVYEEFFEKNNTGEIYKEFDPAIYRKYIKDLPILKDKKILILMSDLVSEGRIEEGIFTTQMCELTSLLDKIYPKQYTVKAHPNMNKLYGSMKLVPPLDYFVPSQFFMNHPWKAVIADCSAALVFPEEQNLGNTKLIELVDILAFKDEDTRKELKDFLVKWNPNLLFPQSFRELEEMIK